MRQVSRSNATKPPSIRNDSRRKGKGKGTTDDKDDTSRRRRLDNREKGTNKGIVNCFANTNFFIIRMTLTNTSIVLFKLFNIL